MPLLSADDIHRLLKPKAEQIINDIRQVTSAAINLFYADYAPKTYDRAFGFSNLANFWFEDLAKETPDGYEVLLKFSSDDVAVNGWTMPSGRDVPGDPAWAFDTGFVHGYHGGPQFPPYHSMGGIWPIIEKYINSL